MPLQQSMTIIDSQMLYVKALQRFKSAMSVHSLNQEASQQANTKKDDMGS